MKDFVNIVHTPTTHDCSLFKFVFLCTLQDDDHFDITAYVNKEFFSDVCLSLVCYRRGRVGETTTLRCTFIGQCIQRYLDHTTYERPELKYAQQPSLVERLKLYNA